MVRSALAAVAAANATVRNIPGRCQEVTRGWYLAPSVGDVDKDGDADAVDGWLSEPAWARHPGDRNPPVGAPVAFSGGGKKYGHRAAARALGGHLRSTDMHDGRYAKGITGNATIDEVERSMGVKYLGWTETISRQRIPGLKVPKPPKKLTSRGWLVDRALKFLETTARHTKRPEAYKRAVLVAVDAVRAIPKVR
jgi:hypothetical protein